MLTTPLRIEFFPSASITSALREEIRLVDEAAFAGLYPGDAEIRWSGSDIMAVGRAGDDLAAITGLLARRAVVGSTPVTLGGVGSVAVLPRLQGNGYGLQMLRAVQAYLRQSLGVDFGLLLCSDALLPFYSNLGWQPVVAPLWFDQPDEQKHRWHENAMILPCRGELWPDGDVDLCGLPW